MSPYFESMKLISCAKLNRIVGALSLGLILVLVAGCASSPNPHGRVKFSQTGYGQSATNRPGVSAENRLSRVLVGDSLTISFTDVPPPGLLEQRVQVPSDGIITLPHNVQIKAADKTTSELEREIRAAYVPSIFVQLTAAVKTEQRVFFVDGEVKTPGRLQFIGEMTLLRAISTAGGFTDFANKKKVEIRRQNGDKIVVNWNEALGDSDLDLPIFPNDYIVVRRRNF
jgi:protein involved in polysaccharide export with SLBB domain